MSNGSDEFINVPVPRHLVTQVYEAIARLEAGEPDEPAPAAPTNNGAAQGAAQTNNGAAQAAAPMQDMVKRMYRESWTPHQRLMEHLADHPDEWISTREIAKALGLEQDAESLAASTAAFDRRAEQRYGGAKPWETRSAPVYGQVQLRMSQKVATWVKASGF